MSLQSDLDAAKAEVTRIEAEIASLPSELLGKTETELASLYHAVLAFFKGTPPPVPEPAPVVILTEATNYVASASGD